MQDNTPWDKIDDFLDSTLSDKERRAFLMSMREDPDLRAQVAEQRLARQVIEAWVAEDVRASLPDIPGGAYQETRPAWYTYRWLIAFLTALIVIAISFYWYSSPSPVQPPQPQEDMAVENKFPPTQGSPTPLDKPEEKDPTVGNGAQQPSRKNQREAYRILASNYYQPYSPPDIRNSTITAEAARAYREQQYKKVVTMLENNPDGLPMGLKLRANALFMLRRYNQAADEFALLAKSSDSEYEGALWNQALSLLAAGKPNTDTFNTLLRQLKQGADGSVKEQVLLLEQKLLADPGYRSH